MEKKYMSLLIDRSMQRMHTKNITAFFVSSAPITTIVNYGSDGGGYDIVV